MTDLATAEPIEPASEDLALVLQKGLHDADPEDQELVKVFPESAGLAKRLVLGFAAITDPADKLPLTALAEEVVTTAALGDIEAAVTAIQEALA